MSRNHSIDDLFDTAEEQRRAVFGVTATQQRALCRRAANGEIVRVYPNMYIRASLYTRLSVADIVLHTVRALQIRHPRWVFTGVTAALVLGLEHQWRLHRGILHTISLRRTPEADSRHLNCVQSSDFDVMVVDGIRVTNPARTVIECCRLHEAREVRAVVDSAMARGLITPREMYDELARMREPSLVDIVHEVAEHANARCENGGESYTDHTIWELGFIAPVLQAEHRHPLTGATIRNDFEFRDAQGLFVVLELDGQDKYVDPGMTRGLTIPEVVEHERHRQQGLELLGATVVRTWFAEVRDRYPLYAKLIKAGVPLRRVS